VAARTLSMAFSPGVHDALMRLAECRPGEVADAGTLVLGAVALGAVIAARWDPTHPRRLGVLYSSGTLRLWDVVADSRRDFAVYLPAAGLDVGAAAAAASVALDAGRGVEATGAAKTHHLSLPDRRAATPITHFDFLPLHTPTGLPRIAFTMRHLRHCFVTDIPLPPPHGVRLDHFLSGSRVWQLATPLPAAPVTCMTSWLVSPLPPTPTAALALGCGDGTVCLWLVSGAFNPETVVAMRSRRIASPAWLLASGGTAAGDAALPSAAVAGAPPPSPQPRVAATVRAHGGARVRCIEPVRLATEDDWASALAAANGDVASPRTGPRAFGRTHGTGLAAHTLFLTGGDDGIVTLWRIAAALPNASNPPPSAAPTAVAGGWKVSVAKVVDLPTDGVPTTAIASTAWPLSTTTAQGSELLSLEALLASRARKVLAAGGGTGHATAAGGFAALAAAPLPATLRAMVVTGNKEGVVTVWEVLSDSRLAALVPEDGPSGSRGNGGLTAAFLNGAAPLSALAAYAAGDVMATAANGRSPAGLRGSRPRIPVPSFRMVSLIHARSVDAVADLDVSPPFCAPDEPYALAVAGVDGTLQVYRLWGSGGLDEGALDAHSPGSAGPIRAELTGSVGGTQEEGGDGHHTPSSAPSAYDVIQHLGLESAALRRLAAVGLGGSEGTATTTSDNRKRGGGGGRDEGDDDAASTLSLPLDEEVGGAGVARLRVARALTVAALAGLRRAFVSCSFNDGARWYRDHVMVEGSEGADSNTALAALMACNGGGDVMLWPRTGLPGEVEVDTPAAGRGAASPPDTPPAPVIPPSPKLPPAVRLWEGAGMGLPGSGEAAPSASRPTPQPALVPVAPPSVHPPAAPEAAAVEVGDNGDTPPQPRLPPTSPSVDGREAVMAAISTSQPEVASAWEGGTTAASSSRLLDDTVASRARRDAGGTKTAVSLSGEGAVSIATGDPTTPRRPRAKSPSLPIASAHLLQLRTAAEDALRGGSRLSLLAAQRLQSAELLPAPRMNGPRGDGGHHDRPTAVDRWLQRASSSLTRKAATSAAAAIAPGTGDKSDAGHAMHKAAAARPPAPTTSAATVAAAVAVTPPPAPVVRNPAKVATALRREAAEDARVATLIARDSAAARTGVDVHPDASSLYERVSARGPAAHHHLVAPVVGSSAAVAVEMARVAGQRFDRATELERLMRHHGIQDPATCRALRAAVTDSVGSAAPHVGDALAYVPAPSGGARSKPIVVVAPTLTPTISATSRLLRPTAATLAGAGHSRRVTAADVTAMHLQGTLRR